MDENFKVPYTLKAIFSVLSVGAVVGLLAFQYEKRVRYWDQHVNNTMNVEATALSHLPVASVTAKDGQILNLSSDKWTLVHFWATWCAPCRSEMPVLEVLQREMKDQLQIVAVSVDADTAAVDRFFGDDRPTFSVGYDAQQKVAQAFNVSRYPESFLVSPEQKVVAHFVGPRDWSSKEAQEFLRRYLHQS